MNFTEFDYIKADGSKSHRVVLVRDNPRTNYFGIDISELTPEAQGALAHSFALLEKDYIDKFKELLALYDVSYNIRQFIPSRMSNVIQEDIE